MGFWLAMGSGGIVGMVVVIGLFGCGESVGVRLRQPKAGAKEGGGGRGWIRSPTRGSFRDRTTGVL